MGLAVLLALGNWIGLLDGPPAVKPPAVFDATRLDIDAPVTVLRANYNYSVIPGGAFSGRELERSVSRDPVVAEHYRDVDALTMRPEILKADRSAYVSYRVGDRVYWTSKKVWIRSGETILSNGRHEIRARCGNGISLEPLMPTSADEPDPMLLDALTDTDPMQLEARTGPGSVLVWWPLNPLVPEPIAPEAAEIFPFPGGFPGTSTAGVPADTSAGGPVPGALGEAGPVAVADSARLDGVALPNGATPPAGARPPGSALAPGGTTLPLGATSHGGVPPTPAGPTVPGFSGDNPFLPDPPVLLDDLTADVTPPTFPDDTTPIPEPATLLLLGGGIAGLLAGRWRASKS